MTTPTHCPRCNSRNLYLDWYDDPACLQCGERIYPGGVSTAQPVRGGGETARTYSGGEMTKMQKRAMEKKRPYKRRGAA